MTVTWNPLDKGSAVTLSNGNLTMSSSTGHTNGNIRANNGVSSGKWYWETKVISGTYVMIGIGNANASLIADDWTGNNTRMYYANGGAKYPGALAYGATYVVNDIIGVALDMDAGTLTFYKNGVSQGVAFTDVKTMGTIVYPYQSYGSPSGTYSVTANFGTTPFAYPIPDDYLALNDSVLEAPGFEIPTDIQITGLNTTGLFGADPGLLIDRNTDSSTWLKNIVLDGVTREIVYIFSQPISIISYDMWAWLYGWSTAQVNPPTGWNIEGFNESTLLWEIISSESVSQAVWGSITGTIKKSFTLPNVGLFKKYKIKITSYVGSVGLTEFSMYKDSSVIETSQAYCFVVS